MASVTSDGEAVGMVGLGLIHPSGASVVGLGGGMGVGGVGAASTSASASPSGGRSPVLSQTSALAPRSQEQAHSYYSSSTLKPPQRGIGGGSNSLEAPSPSRSRRNTDSAMLDSFSDSSPAGTPPLPQMHWQHQQQPVAPLPQMPSHPHPHHHHSTNNSSSISTHSNSSSGHPAIPQRRRESSTPPIMPRPILKDTSARDRAQRETWMSSTEQQPPFEGGVSPLHSRPNSGYLSSGSTAMQAPLTPPKNVARANSAKRKSKSNRNTASTMSTMEYDQDALTPRHRSTGAGYGADYRPRRQSGGPGHLLYGLDNSSVGDPESEGYEDSEGDEPSSSAAAHAIYSKHLQEQYLRLQKSHLRQSLMDHATTPSPPTSRQQNDDPAVAFQKRSHRKSLGDELNLPPVPEKSMQRKRVSTMDSATLTSNLPEELQQQHLQKSPQHQHQPHSSPQQQQSQSQPQPPQAQAQQQQQQQQPQQQQQQQDRASAPKDSKGMLVPSPGQPRDRRSHGSAHNMTFEPLFALRDGNKSGDESGPSRPVSSGGGGGGSTTPSRTSLAVDKSESNRLSAVSDSEWYASEQATGGKGVCIIDRSRRQLEAIPTDLPTGTTHLRLANNAIKVLAPITTLATLTHMQVLDLCHNELKVLPPEIGLLTRLKELYVSFNKLKKLPDTIQRMSRLEVLDIKDNQIYRLNPSVGKLRSLRHLDVRNNQLKALPAELCNVSKTLTVLLIDGNRFVPPFSDLLQPLMLESSNTDDARQSYLSDDPYADTGRNLTVAAGIVYEPWRRTVAPTPVRRVPTVVKRRSHGDLMSLMGFAKRDGDGDLGVEDLPGWPSENPRASTMSPSMGSTVAAQLAEHNGMISPTRTISNVATPPPRSTTPGAAGAAGQSLSLNKLFKSIRKSSKGNVKDPSGTPPTPGGGLTSSPAEPNTPYHNNRLSIGTELDFMDGQGDDGLDSTGKPKSASSSRRGGGINQWVRDRFHKRSSSNDSSNAPGSDFMASSNNSSGDLPPVGGATVRDSGYGTLLHEGQVRRLPNESTPDLGSMSPTAGVKSMAIMGKNKSTGHLPYMSEHHELNRLSSSFDASQQQQQHHHHHHHQARADRSSRYSYMSSDSQLTMGTELDPEGGLGHDQPQAPSSMSAQQQQQQHPTRPESQEVSLNHRLSSVHSPTTPLPSSPRVVPRRMMAANQQDPSTIRPLLHYLRDVYDLDPDSSEWEEVYAWRRVWNAERSSLGSKDKAGGHGGAGGDRDGANGDDDELDQEEEEARLNKAKEMQEAKLKSMASKRRKI
ncbi:hypothetical protein BGZ73_000462, partial [Actinomortierella ambigua]